MTEANRSGPEEDPRPSPQAELERIVSAALDGGANEAPAEAKPEDAARLQTLLADPAALNAYLDQMQMHALLQWRHGKAAPQFREPSESRPRPRSDAPLPRRALLAGAAAFLALAGAGLLWLGGGLSAVPPPVGEVADASGVVWEDGQTPLATGTPLRPGKIHLRSGTLHLRLGSDVRAAVVGPARFEVLSAMRLRAGSGRITARVGAAGKGFTVESPAADVVDLGTEFGVHVDEGGSTDVVVFDGEVDLHRKRTRPHSGAPDRPAATRMTKGEGLQVGRDGALARIWTVAGALGGADWAAGSDGAAAAQPTSGALVSAVRDNLRDPSSQKYYRIVRGGLQEDAPAYVDRDYEWNGLDAAGLPPELRGADLVMTFNDDKKAQQLELSLSIARPAALYVFLRDEKKPPPEWLVRDFMRTPLRIGMDEGPRDRPDLRFGKGPGAEIDVPFTVWRREIRTPGVVVLGGNAPVQSMYGVAAAPLE